MDFPAKKLLLVGGGHAHVAVLADMIERGLPCQNVTLLTPYASLRYSGTVPGWIAGQYARGFGTVDLAGLAKRAGVALVLGRCQRIDPEDRWVETDGGQHLAFDVASLDTGGVGKAEKLLGSDLRLIDIRPIDGFVRKLDVLPAGRHFAVVGGGAGGTELAFAMRNRAGTADRPDITFILGEDGLLPGFSRAVRKTVRAEMERQEITVIAGNARIEDGRLMAGAHCIEPVDAILAAMGSGAPAWPGEGGLACDPQGFVAVDAYQRSTSHPHVFAVGDVAARQDRLVPHSGVHAVFAGPVLARNLRDALGASEPRASYRPRWNNLYLMSTGDGSAIASYGPFAAEGRWVARLKHWIDNRWLSKYAELAKGAELAQGE